MIYCSRTFGIYIWQLIINFFILSSFLIIIGLPQKCLFAGLARIKHMDTENPINHEHERPAAIAEFYPIQDQALVLAFLSETPRYAA